MQCKAVNLSLKKMTKYKDEVKLRSSLVAQQIKDLALSLLWHGFNSWLRNFHRLEEWQKKKKKRKKRKEKEKKGRKISLNKFSTVIDKMQ